MNTTTATAPVTSTVDAPAVDRVHLHVGVDAPHILRAAKTALRMVAPAGGDIIIDGDQWEVWGEDADVGQPMHLVVETASIEQAREVAERLRALGVLRRSTDSYAIEWAITSRDDWAVVLDTDTGYINLEG